MGDKSSMDNFETVKNALEKIESEMQGLRNDNDDLRRTVQHPKENQQKLPQTSAPASSGGDANMGDKKTRFVALKKLGDTPVSAMPGVGDGSKLEQSLIEQNMKAWHVVGKYISLCGDYKEFKDWLKDEFGATTQQNAVYDGVKEWCVKNLPL